jgi:hypothetical protein
VYVRACMQGYVSTLRNECFDVCRRGCCH